MVPSEVVALTSCLKVTRVVTIARPEAASRRPLPHERGAHMALFRPKTEEEIAAKEAEKAQRAAAAEAKRAQAERAAFLSGPVGRAQTAYANGDLLHQLEFDLMAQEAIIVAMVGSKVNKRSSDPSEILNAIAKEGWDLVNASVTFVTEGEQSRDKFLSSGQNVAVKGRLVGFYVFRRCPENRAAAIAA
jgi:hypothetical protein